VAGWTAGGSATPAARNTQPQHPCTWLRSKNRRLRVREGGRGVRPGFRCGCARAGVGSDPVFGFSGAFASEVVVALGEVTESRLGVEGDPSKRRGVALGRARFHR